MPATCAASTWSSRHVKAVGTLWPASVQARQAECLTFVWPCLKTIAVDCRSPDGHETFIFVVTDSTAESTFMGMSLEQLSFAQEQAQGFEVMCLKRVTDRVPMILRLVDPLTLAREGRLATYMAINRDPDVSGLLPMSLHRSCCDSCNQLQGVSHA